MRLRDSRYTPKQKRIIVVGNYGSGKTEVSVNLALALRAEGRAVSIADLDVVNPYFRCREERDAMAAAGIQVVIPPGERRFADVPIVVPEIKGMFENDHLDAPVSIFDVGGDDMGALLLSSMREAIGDRPYELLQVVNTKRPFTDSADGCLEMKRRIEVAARLSMTGLVVNAHLMDETTPSVILEGVAIAEEVSAKAGIPIAFVAVRGDLLGAPELHTFEHPVLPLERRMAPPWVEGGRAETDGVSRMEA